MLLQALWLSHWPMRIRCRCDIGIRKPKEGEQGIRMKSGEIVSLIRREYPSIQNNHSTKIHLGLAMKELGFEGKTHGNQTFYRVIPLKAA